MSHDINEYETFDEWYQERDKHLHEATDRETREWSRFMGYPVTPMQIADLRIQLNSMLEREAYEARWPNTRFEARGALGLWTPAPHIAAYCQGIRARASATVEEDQVNLPNPDGREYQVANGSHEPCRFGRGVPIEPKTFIRVVEDELRRRHELEELTPAELRCVRDTLDEILNTLNIR